MASWGDGIRVVVGLLALGTLGLGVVMAVDESNAGQVVAVGAGLLVVAWLGTDLTEFAAEWGGNRIAWKRQVDAGANLLQDTADVLQNDERIPADTRAQVATELQERADRLRTSTISVADAPLLLSYGAGTLRPVSSWYAKELDGRVTLPHARSAEQLHVALRLHSHGAHWEYLR